MPMRVAVVGGGVIGLTSAVAAQEKIPGLQMTLITEHLSPYTTSDGAGGIWMPHYIKDTPDSDIQRWSCETHDFMLKLWQSEDAGKAGISLVSNYMLSRNPEVAERPLWSEIPFAFQNLNKHQASKLTTKDNRNKYFGGTHFVSFILESSFFLPYLMEKFKKRGGLIEQRKVKQLEDLAEEGYDVIFNCTGVQARYLGDAAVVPIRGQVLRVKAPWILNAVSEEDDDGYYIIPNQETVVLGGTHQEGDWNVQVNAKDSEMILDECTKLIPSLRDAEITKEWVGLRPGRYSVRLEHEELHGPNGKTMQVIHNYGHGGSGITLCWGCAQESTEILKKILLKTQKSKL